MRALIVEDDRRIAEDLTRALGSVGFRVEAATDGEKAWFLGGTENYDLIVLDLGLPKLDGLSVLKRWRAEGGCPVYGLGGITPQNAAHVRALGFDGMAFIGSVWESAQPVQAFLELERAWSGKDARKLKRKH